MKIIEKPPFHDLSHAQPWFTWTYSAAYVFVLRYKFLVKINNFQHMTRILMPAWIALVLTNWLARRHTISRVNELIVKGNRSRRCLDLGRHYGLSHIAEKIWASFVQIGLPLRKMATGTPRIPQIEAYKRPTPSALESPNWILATQASSMLVILSALRSFWIAEIGSYFLKKQWSHRVP